MLDTSNITSSMQLLSPMVYDAMKAIENLPEDPARRFNALDEVIGDVSTVKDTLESIVDDLNAEMSRVEDLCHG